MSRSRFGLTAGTLFAMTFVMACSRPEPAPPATPPAVQTATGRIQGVVRLRGEPPVTRREPNSKQPEVCGDQVSVTRIDVGPDKGVAHAFVYLDGVAASGPPRPAASVTVGQKDCVYGPRAAVMTPGSRLEIVNDDPVLHNVHAAAMSENGKQTIFNIAQPVRGQRTAIDAELKPGIVTLTCEAGHPWMTAHMLVTDHGYVAVTDEHGRFTIDQVPVGTYPLRLWHEGVALTRIITSLQRFEYEPPYELNKDVVVTAGNTSEIEFELELRKVAP